MKRLAAAACVGVLLALRLAVPCAAAAPRVRLLVPTRADLSELAVLTRAELVAAGFEVDHRAVPAGPLAAWLQEAHRDRVLAVVALEPAPAQVRLWLLEGGPAAPPEVLSEAPAPVDRTTGVPTAGAGDAATSRARTTLALRIAERILAHRTALAVPAAAAPARAPASPFSFEALLLAGRSLHPTAAAVGLELGLARRFGAWGLWRLGFCERAAVSAMAAPAGTARPYETALVAGLGLVRSFGRLTPELSLGLGAQHTWLVGQGAQGFQGHREGTLAAVVALRAAARLDLGRVSVLLAARTWQLVPWPVVLIDEVTVSRAGPGFEVGLGLGY
jgi:hypothetical protein